MKWAIRVSVSSRAAWCCSTSAPASCRPRRISASASRAAREVTKRIAKPMESTATAVLARKIRFLRQERTVIRSGAPPRSPHDEVQLHHPALGHAHRAGAADLAVVPRLHRVGAGGDVVEPVAPFSVGGGEKPVREDEDVGAHVGMDLAEYPDHPGPVEANGLAAAFFVPPQVE